jgi:hypothetical protein
MNNNKESDKTYIVVWCELNPEVTTDRYVVCDSLNYAQKLYAQLIDSEECYSANITQVIESTDYHQTRGAKIVNKAKETDDDGYSIYLMLHLLDSMAFFTDHTCDEMWEEAKKQISLWKDSQYNNTDCDYSLYECFELYVRNLTDNSMYPKEKKQPKKITNDFDHWITELEKIKINMTDWLSYNTENFQEEYLIDEARKKVKRAVQSIQENKTKNVTALPTANCVTAVLDYILYSEMGGTYDATDSWHSTYQLLMELRNDKIDPDDLSYVSDLKPLH